MDVDDISELRLTQLRALDFGTDSPLVDYAQLVIYHPLEGALARQCHFWDHMCIAGNGHPFASLSWMGFIGTVTSYSGIMGQSEKVIHLGLGGLSP